jgi:hypothetical protein
MRLSYEDFARLVQPKVIGLPLGNQMRPVTNVWLVSPNSQGGRLMFADMAMDDAVFKAISNFRKITRVVD